MADCIRLGLLGLRRNSPMVVNVICFAVLQILCSQQRIERPIRGRNALRKAWAIRCKRRRNRDKRLGIVCRSIPSHPVLRGERPCQAVAGIATTGLRPSATGMRTCGRWPLLKACEGCEFIVGQAGGVESGGKDATIKWVGVSTCGRCAKHSKFA